MPDPRAHARALAEEALRRGDAVGWFETLYREVGGDWARVPWADLVPNPHLVEWLGADGGDRSARRALVVGCGLGDDAEAVAARGYRVVAFDVSPTAIEGCRRRYPDTRVDYRDADLFDPPVDWAGGFDLVVEVNTLQVLPDDRRAEAMRQVGDFVRPGGRLLVVAGGTRTGIGAGCPGRSRAGSSVLSPQRDSNRRASRISWTTRRRRCGASG